MHLKFHPFGIMCHIERAVHLKINSVKIIIILNITAAVNMFQNVELCKARDAVQYTHARAREQSEREGRVGEMQGERES